MSMAHTKYRPSAQFSYPERTWPDNPITEAPIWCSTDLRDGNQALQVPMNLEQKLAFFNLLVDIGFKQIEVAFPSASDTEYKLVRTLIEENRIPDDVTIEVFTQARDHLIQRTFESVKDAKKAIIHLYNSTCPLHRDVVFQMEKQQIIDIAVRGATQFKHYAQQYGPEKYTFEYSPETFNATEMDFIIELCNAVLDVWQPTPNHKAIINLPETVQFASPNVYADQIEYVSNHLNYRDAVIISLHTHNDRGTGVAATELALMAGAQRVEGTLFGNGERTGNVDLVTMALNMYTQGVNPGLDFSNLDHIIAQYEQLTQMKVPPRYPYAGELVYTAFSGSHQDAIKKGMERLGTQYERWEMPYLIIDPKDLGRSYEALIRVNSQSGKGGVFYLLEQHYGIKAPKAMQQEFGALSTKLSDEGQKELSPQELYAAFTEEYVNLQHPLSIVSYQEQRNGNSKVTTTVNYRGEEHTIQGSGNGLLDAICNAVSTAFSIPFDICEYRQNAMQTGSASAAISYIGVMHNTGKSYYGAGIDTNIGKSSIKALASAINRLLVSQGQ